MTPELKIIDTQTVNIDDAVDILVAAEALVNCYAMLVRIGKAPADTDLLTKATALMGQATVILTK